MVKRRNFIQAAPLIFVPHAMAATAPSPSQGTLSVEEMVNIGYSALATETLRAHGRLRARLDETLDEPEEQKAHRSVVDTLESVAAGRSPFVIDRYTRNQIESVRFAIDRHSDIRGVGISEENIIDLAVTCFKRGEKFDTFDGYRRHVAGKFDKGVAPVVFGDTYSAQIASDGRVRLTVKVDPDFALGTVAGTVFALYLGQQHWFHHWNKEWDRTGGGAGVADAEDILTSTQCYSIGDAYYHTLRYTGRIPALSDQTRIEAIFAAALSHFRSAYENPAMAVQAVGVGLRFFQRAYGSDFDAVRNKLEFHKEVARYIQDVQRIQPIMA